MFINLSRILIQTLGVPLTIALNFSHVVVRSNQDQEKMNCERKAKEKKKNIPCAYIQIINEAHRLVSRTFEV